MSTVTDRRQAPAWLADLLHRAADHFEAHWPATAVEFRYQVDPVGTRYPYRAVLDRQLQIRLYDGRSAMLVCQSLPWQPLEVDPDCWNTDTAEEEA